MRFQRPMQLAVGCCCAICVVCAGCGDSAPEVPATPAVPATPVAATAKNAPAEAEAKTDAPPAAGAEAEPEADPDQAAFAPPFPDRADLFQAPKRQGSGLAKSKGQAETSVELIGFVKVDQDVPRALLAVNGLIAPIAEGDKHFGIEVVSIQPPKVFLRRGRQRFQASLPN